MTWTPISKGDFESLLSRDLSSCSEVERQFFEQIRIPQVKWKQSPWGDEGGGFWAVAVKEGRVVWYNDIEEGFNISPFTTAGVIPRDEYWCNQDSLRLALARFKDGFGPLRWTAAVADMLDAAQGLIDGRIDALKAADLISRTRAVIDPKNQDADLTTLWAISSESDEMMTFDSSKEWAAAVKQAKEAEYAKAEASYRPDALRSAAALIARYGWPAADTK